MLSDPLSLPVGLVKLNAKLFPKKYMLVPRSTKVKEERLYLTLHRDHQMTAFRWAAMRAI